jgi:hypothetical protein
MHGDNYNVNDVYFTKNVTYNVVCSPYRDCNFFSSIFLNKLFFIINSMTDHFIDLLNSFRQDPNFSKLGDPAALKKLFNQFVHL